MKGGVRRWAELCLLAAALLFLAFFYSARYAALLFLLLLFLMLLLRLGLRWEAKAVELQLTAPGAGRVGQPLRLELRRRAGRPLFFIGGARVELEVRHAMFERTEQYTLNLPFQNGGEMVSLPLEAGLCGDLELHCRSVRLYDLLSLFERRGRDFPPVYTMIYPKPMRITLQLQKAPAGTMDSEGFLQNRPGRDRSEVYDLREYRPGDDLRDVHWKLSGKLDTLVLRQAGCPMQYDLALLPDLSCRQGERESTAAERNSAAALTIAIGEKLLQQTSFCLLVPTERGLRVQEIRERRQLYKYAAEWLSEPVSVQAGRGLRQLQTEHMEQRFTRLLIVSAGKYAPEINVTGTHRTVTVISTDEETEAPLHQKTSACCAHIFVPAVQPQGMVYRLEC